MAYNERFMFISIKHGNKNFLKYSMTFKGERFITAY